MLARIVAVLCALPPCFQGGLAFAADEAAAAEPRRAALRGAASAVRALREASDLAWLPLGDHRVADSEGHQLLAVSGDLDLCKQVCSNYQGCRSFAWCGARCFLKDAEISGSSPSHFNPVCTTYYQGAETTTTTTTGVPPPPSSGAASPTTTTAASASSPAAEDECHRFTSELVLNQGQQFPGNPEPNIHGKVDLLLCTNGTMVSTLEVEGGHSEIIATHIHHCQGGTSPQTKTATLCSGPPVINFCGSNAPGLIDDGSAYAEACSGYGSDDTSRTMHVQGTLVQQTAGGLSVAERVKDIAAHPNMYYFNVHTEASWNKWYPEPKGSCRGPLHEELAGSDDHSTPPPASATPAEGNRCFTLYSQLSMNELQIYPRNPDSRASGYASLTLCTNGTLTGTLLVYGGVSEIIATHIHHCQGGDTPQTRTADLCEGPPVLNFCGQNGAGLIEDGVSYPEACAPYSGLGASKTEGMRGVLIPGQNVGMTVAERVMDIAQNPDMYYFNVHSDASYLHWYPHHNGMCRGPVQLWGTA